MANASIEDFEARLEQSKTEFTADLAIRKRTVTNDMARKGALQSSMTIMSLLRTLDEGVNEYVGATGAAISKWSGLGHLSVDDLSRSATLHLRATIEEFVKPTFLKIGQSQFANSMLDIIEDELGKIRQAAEARVREIELGVGLVNAGALPAGTVFNVIHAGSISGGIQQGTTASKQTNTVILTTGEIEAALDRVEAVVAHETLASVRDEIAGDVSTIRAQLQKSEPNHNILREAGRTIKTVLEGAIGGAIGGAATPALSHAAMSLGVALGL